MQGVSKTEKTLEDRGPVTDTAEEITRLADGITLNCERNEASVMRRVSRDRWRTAGPESEASIEGQSCDFSV